MKPKHSLFEQVNEAQRELGMRREVYPRLVAKRQKSQSEADYLISVQESILRTLQFLERNRDQFLAFLDNQEQFRKWQAQQPEPFVAEEEVIR